MSKSAFDDTSIDSISSLLNVTTEPGGITRLALDSVIPDPDQPREDFDEGPLKELAASIENQGVLQPITVGPAGEDGKHIIKYGERRWRASVMAEGVEDIPVIISEHDADSPYAQMIENIQREDLSPMEIGKWINRRIESGEKAKDIAAKLGTPASFVSLHKDLPSLPPFILSLYHQGIQRSPRVLVDLKRAVKLDADATAKFCKRAMERGQATKKDVDEFVSLLKKQETLKNHEDDDETTTKPGGTEETGEGTEPTKTPATPKPKAVPVVHVRIGNNDKVGMLLLDRPSEGDSVWCDFDGSQALMDMSDVRIVKVKS